MRLAATPSFSSTRVKVPGGVAGIFETVRRMREHVETCKSDPAILNLAVTIIHQFPQHDQAAEVCALHDFVRAHIRYVRDPAGLESLADPLSTVRRGVGDCDDQATLLGTLFEAVGYPTRFVLAGYHSRDYEHVYLEVLYNNQWWACDPTMPEAFGWEPDAAIVKWHEFN